MTAGTRRRRPRIPPVDMTPRTEQSWHILLWQVRGQADLEVDGDRLSLRDGQAMWVPARTRHAFTVHADSVTMPLFFDAERARPTLEDPTMLRVDADLRTLMLAYSVSSSTAIKVPADLGSQILAAIADRRLRSFALPLPRSAHARAIADALRADPGDPRGVEQWAASVHTTARTIERAFRAETGLTLRQWRIRNRLEAAEELLRGGASPDVVAHRVGYTHVNSFRRVFTQSRGVSPSEWVRRHVGR